MTLKLMPIRYSLQPFHASAENGVDVRCIVAEVDGHVKLEFRISGAVNELVIPKRDKQVTRSHGLWETTCFECFLRREDRNGYWEVNISPSGCWNVYFFSSYREGMSEESTVTSLSSEIQRTDAFFSLCCLVPVQTLFKADQGIRFGLSCVLEYKNGEKAFLAITHPGDQPDFHHPEGMVQQLR